MSTFHTILAVIVVIVLLYVAFIVGAVLMRIVFGLLAILVAGYMVRMLVASWNEKRTP